MTGHRMAGTMAAIVVAAALSISTVVVVSYASSHVTADAGPDQTVTEGDTVRLSGTTIGSNPSDTLTYGWYQGEYSQSN